jgi:ABC-type uncharacterized transport system auxiliary subunit
MKHSLIALSLLLSLTACDLMPPAGLKPFEVDIKVPVQCKHTLPPEPTWQLTITPPDADIADQAKAAIIEIQQRIDYEDDLRTEILNCQ